MAKLKLFTCHVVGDDEAGAADDGDTGGLGDGADDTNNDNDDESDNGSSNDDGELTGGNGSGSGSSSDSTDTAVLVLTIVLVILIVLICCIGLGLYYAHFKIIAPRYKELMKTHQEVHEQQFNAVASLSGSPVPASSMGRGSLVWGRNS